MLRFERRQSPARDARFHPSDDRHLTITSRPRGEAETFQRTERRRVLVGTAGVLTGLAGRSTLSTHRPTLDLTVFNRTDSPYTVEMTVLKSGGDRSRSDARLYDASLDVSAGGKTVRRDAFEERRCIVRYRAYRTGERLTDYGHIHYYPPGDGQKDDVAFDIHSPEHLTRRTLSPIR